MLHVLSDYLQAWFQNSKSQKKKIDVMTIQASSIQQNVKQVQLER